MSSWDRCRSLPWSRAIPVAPANAEAPREDIDLQKERIWRDLAREAANEEKEIAEKRESEKLADGDPDQSSSAAINDASSSLKKNEPEVNILGYVGRPYQTTDLLRNTAFGATIGSITGMCFGFMDSIRAATSSDVLKSASRSAQGKFVFQGTYRSGFFFGSFVGVFHTIKYGTRVLVDPGDFGEICAASLVTMGGVVARREWRASVPYAAMLIAMDSFHVFMREI